MLLGSPLANLTGLTFLFCITYSYFFFINIQKLENDYQYTIDAFDALYKMKEDQAKYGDEGITPAAEDFTNLTGKSLNISISMFNRGKLEADHKLVERAREQVDKEAREKYRLDNCDEEDEDDPDCVEEEDVAYEYYEDENLPVDWRRRLEQEMVGLLHFEFFTFKRKDKMPESQQGIDPSSMDKEFKERYGFTYMN